VETKYGDGTRILNEILCGKRVFRETRDGLTDILAESYAEICRSKSCFTTEFYNSIINLGLKCHVHVENITETPLSAVDSEVTRWLKLGLPTIAEINKLVRKSMADETNEALTADDKLNMKYLRCFLNHKTNYSPRENMLRCYYFDGMFDYDRLDGILGRANEREIYSLLDINRIRHNREKYLRDNALTHAEIMDLHNAYVDKITQQSALDNASKHTALYFLKRFHAYLYDSVKKYIPKTEFVPDKNNNRMRDGKLVFTLDDLKIINAVYKYERKKKNETRTFNAKSNIIDIMRFVSKLTCKFFGSKFIVSNSVRTAYVEVSHKGLILDDYEPTFATRLEETNVDINKLPNRSALKHPDTYKDFFKTRNAKLTRFSDRYSSKTDVYDNKIITRKMKNSPYQEAVPYWNPVKKRNPHYIANKTDDGSDSDCEFMDVDECDKDNHADKYLYPYERDATINKHFNAGIYEPSLSSVTRLSTFISRYDTDYMKIFVDIRNPPDTDKETDTNIIKLYQSGMDVVENSNIAEDIELIRSANSCEKRDKKFPIGAYDMVAKPKDTCVNRSEILLRRIRYKITMREKKILPDYEPNDIVFVMDHGYGFIFKNISIPLEFYALKITYGFNFIAKYELDMTQPYKLPNNIIDGNVIQRIYITHLEASVTHKMKNIKADTSFTKSF